MLSRVDWSRAKLFVEYGPGVGTFCGTILERLAPDATLLVIDTNPVFIDYLRRKFADTRFIAVHGSAATALMAAPHVARGQTLPVVRLGNAAGIIDTQVIFLTMGQHPRLKRRVGVCAAAHRRRRS